jgi:inhibitor of KinA
MRWLAYGPHALLILVADRPDDRAFQHVRAIVTEIEEHPIPGLVEFIPAFTSILLEFDPAAVPDPPQIAPQLSQRFASAVSRPAPPGPLKEIPVTYDGDDLRRISEAKQLTIAQIAEIHATPIYRVCMLGFAPGFPYLGGLDPRLHMPRLDSPRPKVRPGSVAVGGEHTGIYTVESPGGWNIIGHTAVKIFDPARGTPHGAGEEMFWLKPGDRVKFVADG